jgi:hypothetical protein
MRRGLLAVGLSGLLLATLFAASTGAQQAPPNALTPQDLAKSVHNPFEDFVKVPLESDTGFGIGPHHNVGDSLNVEPVLPFRLTKGWDLIARPNLTAAYLPGPHEQFGLQDLQTSFFLTPHSANVWLWGVGPIFQFPSATSRELGTGRWSAGPTGALLYSQGPWFNGILADQLMSFAGNRDRGSVNQTDIEAQISYNFESGWYIQTDPTFSCDWTADQANAWTVPVGADVGKAFALGSQQISLQIGSYDFVKHPDGAPEWMIRASITLLFPSGT